MQVVVDGKTGLAPSSEVILKALFAALRRETVAKKRAILAFTLDGEVLTRDREAALSEGDAGAYSLLEVKTIDPISLSKETLAGLLAHADNLARAHDKASDLTVAGEYSKALPRFEELFHGWDILTRAVLDISMLVGVDLGTMQLPAGPALHTIQQLQQALVRFKAAFETRDVVRIGDIAMHELKPLLSSWREIIDALDRRIQAGPAS